MGILGQRLPQAPALHGEAINTLYPLDQLRVGYQVRGHARQPAHGALSQHSSDPFMYFALLTCFHLRLWQASGRLASV